MDSGKLAFTSRVKRLALIEPRGWASSQALTLLKEARFIVWYLRCPYFVECWRHLKHFWNNLACVGKGPGPGSHTEKSHVLYPCLCEALYKYQIQSSGRPYALRTTNAPVRPQVILRTSANPTCTNKWWIFNWILSVYFLSRIIIFQIEIIFCLHTLKWYQVFFLI